MTSLANRLLKDDLTNFSDDAQMSTNLNSKKSLIRRLRKGRAARARFVESHLDKKLALQIRSLRGDLSQEEMEQKTGIKQQAISRLENPYYGKATLSTLKKIASANDVGLLVEFVPYSELINRVSGTPYVELGYGPRTMNVPSFEEEEEQNAFESQDGPPLPREQSQQLGSAPHDIDWIDWQRDTRIEAPLDLPNPQGKAAPLPPIPPPGARGAMPQDQIYMGGLQ
jgi:transcriptional regulator with XRE-family HTH domain